MREYLMREYLMKLVDGGIKDIEYEHDSIKGCPTCDYGKYPC